MLLSLIAGAFAFFGLGLYEYFSLEALKEQREVLRGYVASNLIFSILIYVLIYISVTSLSLPGAAILTLAGGALFGLFLGSVIVSFSSTVGATVAFCASRFVLRDFVGRHVGKFLGAVNQGVETEGPLYLFGLRLVPLFPFFVVNLVMGLTRMRTWTFFWVSQMGMLPGTIAYVNAGTQLGSIESLGDVLSANVLLAFVSLGVLPIVAKRMLSALRSWLPKKRV